jgi:hypothetical protein
MSATRRGRFGTKKLGIQTAFGALTVVPDPRIMTLELGLRPVPDETGAGAPPTIGFDGGLRSADRLGHWCFDGDLTIGETSCPFELSFVYQGVCAWGATPVAWLIMVDTCLATEPGRRGRRRGLEIRGDLNAHLDQPANGAPQATAPVCRSFSMSSVSNPNCVNTSSVC